MMKSVIFILLAVVAIASCTETKKEVVKDQRIDGPTIYQGLSDDQLLDTIQYYTFQYFWDGAEPNSGMGRERYHMSDNYPKGDKHIVTVGGSGFGLMAIVVAVERGWITREAAVERFNRIADFLAKADRFHGVWPHWLNGETGKARSFSKKDNGGDLVETSFMVQGLITVQEYFKNGNEQERALSAKVEKLWKEVEFNWHQNNEDVLYWHWSPDYNWEMKFGLEGYNECLIAYIVGAASPDYQITAEAFHKGWNRGGDIVKPIEKYGYELTLKHNSRCETGGPLFWAHYSYLGFNPTNASDRYANYMDINIAHTMINRGYCLENPHGYKGYGEDLWGLTASYSLYGYSGWVKEGGRATSEPNFSEENTGYSAHSGDSDFSVISPTAALSSFPYAPEECMKVARNLYENLGNKAFGKFGPYDALSVEFNWYPQKYLAIDQGPIVVMIENYRSGLIWNLFMGNEDVKKGLKHLDIDIKE